MENTYATKPIRLEYKPVRRDINIGFQKYDWVNYLKRVKKFSFIRSFIPWVKGFIFGPGVEGFILMGETVWTTAELLEKYQYRMGVKDLEILIEGRVEPVEEISREQLCMRIDQYKAWADHTWTLIGHHNKVYLYGKLTLLGKLRVRQDLPKLSRQKINVLFKQEPAS